MILQFRLPFLTPLFLFTLISYPSPFAYSGEIPKGTWSQDLKKSWPQKVCQTIPIHCWKVSKKQCVNEAESTLPGCLKEMDRFIPPSMKDPDETSAVGRTVGFCAGRKLGTTLDKKYGRNIASKQCKDLFNEADLRLTHPK